MRYIGDVHGKWRSYKEIALEVADSVQVGDFGMGFHSVQNTKDMNDFHLLEQGHHRFIRGNHDSPAICKEMVGWVEDGLYEEATSTMYLGGAWSIDYARRTPGVDWWADEELSYEALVGLIEKYDSVKPSIMVTHDCPEQVAQELFFGGRKQDATTRTRKALEYMFEGHKPDLWVFGHWHTSVRKKINGTEFVCLAELECLDT